MTVGEAIDEAVTEQIKARFSALCGNLAGGQTIEVAGAAFERGLEQIKQADKAARLVIAKVFAP